ncbi:opsin 6, group member a isoform X1 [Pseudoliparis swirei]|uniref:opsin 6, group member a isoform X1 n=1 Tax=Pseudoliparis swirei TaxID=2059687 RepID=UPI0024BF06EB|nr:opsin 6, group member a isoform X1 [Pseudoliparis swirei]
MEITLKDFPVKFVNIPWRNNNLSSLNADPPLSENGETLIGVYLLVLDGFFTLLFGLASINTLTVISITRYIKGCHQNKAYCISHNTIAVSLICIWTGAMFWSVAPLLGWGSFTDRGYDTCEVDWSKANYSTIHKSYIISILIFCFFIPVMIMLFSYVSIINTVKSTHAMSADGFLTARQRKVERDVTRISIVICTAFIMAWSPYAVVSMWSAWGFHVPSTTSIITRLFAKSASFYNPLIYFGMSSTFRKDISVLLPCTRERREVVYLQHFKNIKLKADAPPTPGSFPIQKLEAKYPASNPGSDSGVNSPPRTPPTDPQGVIHADLPSHIETSQYWCDRL